MQSIAQLSKVAQNDDSPDEALVARALARDRAAAEKLITMLTPVIRARVARSLRRSRREIRRSDLIDLMQEVFVALLEDDGKVLRRWEPGRGLSLMNFVGLVAEREAGAILRSGRRSGWAEDPTDNERFERTAAPSEQPEGIASSRQRLSRLLEGLRERLSPRNFALFEALYVDQDSVDTVAAKFKTTPNAIYTFRSRLKAEIERIRDELTPTPSPARESVP